MKNRDLFQSSCEIQLQSDCELRLTLNNEEFAAVEGWRAANNLPSMAHAVRELLRLGLLSEISKVYGVVSAVRDSVDG